MAIKFKKGDLVKPIHSDFWVKVVEVEETEGGFDYVHCSLPNGKGVFCWHSDQLTMVKAA